jgi:hypothetical protein
MASMTFKRAAAVAALATSVVLMGGAAFASPATPSVGGHTTAGLVPEPVSKAHQTVRNTEAEGVRQLGELRRLF